MENKKKIPFSPPDIGEEEIKLVTEVLRSGWITSGPKLAEFEAGIEKYLNVNKTLALNSATAAMELVLKVFDIKEKLPTVDINIFYDKSFLTTAPLTFIENYMDYELK